MIPSNKLPVITELAKSTLVADELRSAAGDTQLGNTAHVMNSNEKVPSFQRAPTLLPQESKGPLHPVLLNAFREIENKKVEQVRAELDVQNEKLKSMFHDVGMTEVEKKVEIISRFSLFRGFTKSPESSQAFQKMFAGEPTNLPVMWGFRAYQPGSRLASKELLTLKNIADGMEQWKQAGLKVNAPIILADLHAQHNNVPANAVPEDQGGVGNEGYEAYYASVAAEAKKLGLPTVRLSEIFTKLEIEPHKVAERGEALTRKPSEDSTTDHSSDILQLSQQHVDVYVKQALHMVERYPTVPVNKAILDMPHAEQNRALVDKAMAYIHFRQGEGAILLPQLSEFFNTNVIPVHVSDPGAESIGVKGLHIFSKNNKDKNVPDIPWKGVKDEKPVISSASKFTAQEVDAIKLVQEKLIRKNKYSVAYSSRATRVAVALSKEGYSGADLLDKAAEKLIVIEEEQKAQDAAKYRESIEKPHLVKARRIITKPQINALKVQKIDDLNEQVDRIRNSLNRFSQWRTVGAELKQHPQILKDE